MAEPRSRAVGSSSSDADRAYLEAAMAALQDFEREMEPNRLPSAEMTADQIAALLAQDERAPKAV
ncbi:MAG: hypothetical protein AAF565_13545 [Pseudomonadota bacterium]